jgi:hypothetical protein
MRDSPLDIVCDEQKGSRGSARGVFDRGKSLRGASEDIGNMSQTLSSLIHLPAARIPNGSLFMPAVIVAKTAAHSFRLPFTCTGTSSSPMSAHVMSPVGYNLQDVSSTFRIREQSCVCGKSQICDTHRTSASTSICGQWFMSTRLERKPVWRPPVWIRFLRLAPAE